MDQTIAIVTGASSGIGKAIAQKFMAEGLDVVNFDLAKPDYTVDYRYVDICSEEEVRKAMNGINNLDILVNNAGIYFSATVEDTTVEELDDILATNIRGPFLMSKYAIPLLKKSHGMIINISSGLAEAADPNSAAYCITKAGVNMLTKAMALQYASTGVRVNAILPGPVDTPLLHKAFSSELELEEYAVLNPMRRIGVPEDIANVALFLTQARNVNGGLYAVDGGESIASKFAE